MEGAASGGLAVLWLVTPCVQYMGAVERTHIQLELVSGQRTSLELQGVENLAALDLMPVYACLLALTVLRVAMSAMASRQAGGRPGS